MIRPRKRRPPKVNPEQLSNLRMTAGGEKRYSIVVDEGRVKEWIGFGWVDLRPAMTADYFKYPEVARE